MQRVWSDWEEVRGRICLFKMRLSGGREEEYREECKEAWAGGWSTEPEGKIFCQIEKDKRIIDIKEGQRQHEGMI